MKRCPTCNSDYEDTFKICPRDGTSLGVDQAAPTAPVTDPMIGSTIAGRFRIVGKLGEGGMGAVYKAEHTKMDRLSAIKILSNNMGSDPDSLARFTREAQMSSRIDHPHAVTIYDYGESETGLVYLAMEYIEGHTLSSLLRSTGPMSLERTLGIAKQTGDALDAAHALTIVHRDLKPDNIMVGTRGTSDWVKVLDFGIAKTAGEDKRQDLTQAGIVIGTPYYMSPEQVSGQKIDHRSDVYSFALIVYEMLTGRLPFGGENTQAVMVSRLTSQPVPLRQANPNVPEAVEAAVMRALTRDREMRTQSAGDLVRDLEDAILGRDKSATQRNEAVSTSALPVGGGATATPQGAPMPTPQGDSYATTPAPYAPMPQAIPPTDRAIPQNFQNAAPTPSFGQPAPTYPQPPPAKKSGAGGIIAGLLVVGLLVVVGGGLITAFVFRDKIFGTKVAGPTIGNTNTAPLNLNSAPPTNASTNKEVSTGEPARMHFEKGNQLAATEKYEEAAAEYRKAIAIQPDYAKAHANLGAALVQLDQNSEAKTVLLKAISLDASNGLAHFDLGIAELRLKDYASAAKAFEKATGLQDDPTAFAYLGFAFDNLGQKAEAKVAYQKYLDAFPRYAAAHPGEDTSTVDTVEGILAGSTKAPTGDEL